MTSHEDMPVHKAASDRYLSKYVKDRLMHENEKKSEAVWLLQQ